MTTYAGSCRLCATALAVALTVLVAGRGSGSTADKTGRNDDPSASATYAPGSVTVFRGVPCRLTVGPTRFALTINAMQEKPLTATVGVTDDSGGTLHEVGTSDSLPVGDQTFRVAEVVFGDRGSVVLEPASPAS